IVSSFSRLGLKKVECDISLRLNISFFTNKRIELSTLASEDFDWRAISRKWISLKGSFKNISSIFFLPAGISIFHLLFYLIIQLFDSIEQKGRHVNGISPKPDKTKPCCFATAKQ